MQQRNPSLGTIALVVALIAILAAALWYAASAWIFVAGPPMPTVGYVAMIFGIVISLIVGCGLMALLFYSSRHGYDEPFQSDHDRE
jgi:membrane associated rhomboid family serine protease